jgi:tetratricopeptide (TPR) repeat protein
MLVQLGDPGDLSDLGILSGDGYLNVADRAAEEIAALIEQRMRQAGIPVPEGSAASAGEAGDPPPPQAGTGAGPEGSAGMAPPLDSEGPQVLDQPGAPEGEKRSEKRARRLPGTLAATVVAVGLGLTGLAVGRPLLARWALAQGDQAFLAYTNEPSRQEHVQRAEQGWEQAVHWDSRLSEGHERLAFMHDLRGQLQEAEVAYLRAEKLVPIRSDLAKRYRNGRANVLAQQPERRQEALDLFDADRDYPRSAIEAAMVRWGNPASVGQASDALEDPSMRQRLADESKTSAGTGSWGFKTSNELLMFHTAAQKRCLLATARAAGRHLLGDERAAADLRPGAKGDCEGIQFQTLELICSRLLQALAGRTPAGSGNPRAAITARWLSCSSPAATTASS